MCNCGSGSKRSRQRMLARTTVAAPASVPVRAPSAPVEYSSRSVSLAAPTALPGPVEPAEPPAAPVARGLTGAAPSLYAHGALAAARAVAAGVGIPGRFGAPLRSLVHPGARRG